MNTGYAVILIDESAEDSDQHYAFCPTGEGGGVDPTCSPKDSGGTTEGGQRSLPGVPRSKPKDSGSPERKETKKILSSGDVTSEEDLGGGANETKLMVIESESGSIPAVFKPSSGELTGLRGNIDGDYYSREIAASEIAEVFEMGDIVPAVVEREIDGEVGSLHEYRNDTLQTHAYEAADVADDRTMAKIAAFDYIIGNEDRHGGNWLSDGNRVVLIDHGLSFPTDEDAFIRSPFADEAKQLDLDLVPDWSSKWSEIDKILNGSGLSSQEKSFTKKRFDELFDKRSKGYSFSDLEVYIST